jgi:hypothetical protein
MPVEYEKDEKLEAMVADLVTNPAYAEFSLLRQHHVKLISCLKVKMDENDEPIKPKGELVELKKQSPLHQVLLDAHYIVVFDYYTWVNPSASESFKKAMIHRALMKINVKDNEEGVVSFGIRRPDVTEFQATVVRFGPFTDELKEFKDALFANELGTNTVLASEEK